MRAQEGKERALLEMCEEWAAGARAKGCEQAEILLDDEQPSLVFLLEHWESKGRFEANAAQELADAELMARFGEVVAGAPSVRQFRPHS